MGLKHIPSLSYFFVSPGSFFEKTRDKEREKETAFLVPVQGFLKQPAQAMSSSLTSVLGLAEKSVKRRNISQTKRVNARRALVYNGQAGLSKRILLVPDH